MVSKLNPRQSRDRILIAEDSRTQAEHLNALLEQGGFDVEVTGNGKKALAAARANPPQLVISDINMPEMDGYALCRALKADAELKNVPVILVTSLSGPADVIHGLECGADNFITKPYEEDSLLTRIKYLLVNNSLRTHSKVRTGIEIDIDGARHFITAERHQILDLLISTYATAMRFSNEAETREDLLQASYQTVKVLQRSAEGLNRVQNEAEAVAEILRRCDDLSFIRDAWILLLDDDGHIRRTDSTGSSTAIGSLRDAGSSTCECLRDLVAGRLTEMTDVASCARLGLSAEAAANTSHVAAPLIGQSRRHGVFCAAPKEAKFTDEESRVLDALGNQLAAALDRTELNAGLERKVAERTEALRQSRESLARAQRVGRIGSADLNLLTGEIVWSEELYNLLGLDSSTVPSTIDSFLTVIPPEDHAFARDVAIRMRSGVDIEPYEFRIVRPNGQERWLYRITETFRDGDGKPTHMSSTIQDITERKHVERELRLSHDNLARGQRIGHWGSIDTDLRTNESRWSDEIYRLLGLAQDDAKADFQRIAALIHPDDREMVRLARDEMAQSQSIIPIEFRIIRPDGELRWLQRLAEIIRDEKDQAVRRIVTLHDITEARKHEDERQRLEDQLRQSQKMEAVGNLTGGIAHDFNNILAVIIGNLDLLNLEIPEGTEARELVGIGIRACERGSELTKSLLAFSRQQPLQPKRIQLNELLTGSVKMMRRAIGEAVEVQLKLGQPVWPVNVDPGLLESALLNMMVNARDAMPNGGVILIETSQTHLDEAYAAANAEVDSGDYALLSVSDTGQGMPPEILSRVFEPFFTTKPKGKGTGLGLAMVFGFVKQSGGHIKIYSEVGHGTTIRIYLPRDEGAPQGEAPRMAPSTSTRETRGETILVVEDNPDVRRSVLKQLRGVGYRVLEAENVRDAIVVLENESKVDLVFSDVIMPGGRTGADLAREVRERWPATKVLLTSGFPEGLLENGNRLPEHAIMLGKPYRMEELLRKLREIIGGTEPLS